VHAYLCGVILLKGNYHHIFVARATHLFVFPLLKNYFGCYCLSSICHLSNVAMASIMLSVHVSVQDDVWLVPGVALSIPQIHLLPNFMKPELGQTRVISPNVQVSRQDCVLLVLDAASSIPEMKPDPWGIYNRDVIQRSDQESQKMYLRLLTAILAWRITV
jgi:hypothetical protein